MIIPEWASRYVGVPYADDGHSLDACNCWGLVYLVLKEQAQVDVPTYAEISAKDIDLANARFAQERASYPWSRVIGEKRRFDVALLRGNPLHAGIMVSSDALLHIWKATSAVVMPIDHSRLRFNLLGFYRHVSLV